MKMKKTLYTLLFASLPILATAQEAAAPLSLSVTEETAPESTPTLRFAWFSQEEVLRSMPEYQAAGRYVDSLKTEYAREAKRSADDFSLKYEEFLDQQRNLATSIRRKRQAELQELMSQNIAFKAEGERLLARETLRAYAPAKRKLLAAVAEIARQRGYAFVLNSDGDNLPSADSAQGDEITLLLKQELSGKK